MRTMIQTFCWLLLTATAQAGPDVVGTWQCTSEDTPLGNLTWQITIKPGGDRLTGTASSGELGTFSLTEINVEGDSLRFKFWVSADLVHVKTKVERDSLAGTWEIEGSTGGAFHGRKGTAPAPRREP